MNSKNNWQLTGFAARISCLAITLLEVAAAGTLGDDQRIMAKALYALARLVTPTPGKHVGDAWTEALYKTLGMSGLDPAMPQFEDRATALRLTDRGLINAIFAETISERQMHRIIVAGRALAGDPYDEDDVVDRGFGLALLAIAEIRFTDREPTADETRERERVYATGVRGLLLWARVSEARERFSSLPMAILPAFTSGQMATAMA